MAGKKTKTLELDIMSRPQLIYGISQMDNDRDKALASFIYLTGARISEIVGTTKTLKKYEGKGDKRTIIDEKEVVFPPLKKENIEINLEEDIMLVHQVPCLKRKDIVKRIIPVIISKEKELFDVFYTWFKVLDPGEILFDMTRQRAWQIINQLELGDMKLFPHYLIHNRCTNLVKEKGFSDLDLKQFRGWSDTRPASVYTHLNWRDLAKKMR